MVLGTIINTIATRRTKVKSIEHETNLFCWRRGFKAKDLGNHPCADDLVLMTRIKDDLGRYLTNDDHQFINGIWGHTLNRNMQLKNSHLKRLELITNTAIQRQHTLAKIKQLRKASV